MKSTKWSAPGFALALAAVALLVGHAPPSSAQPAKEDRYGTRKPACGCYVCGKLIAVTFEDKECAGILSADACGQRLANLPDEKRASFCQKIKATVKFSSFKESCPAYAPYCGPEQTAAQGPASGGAASPGQPGKQTPAPGATPPKPGKGEPGTPKEVPVVAGSPGPGTTTTGTKLVLPPPSPPVAAGPPASTAKAIPPSATTEVPRPLASLRVNPPTGAGMPGGIRVQGIVELTEAPGPGGLTVTLESGNPQLVSLPPSVTFAYGTTSADTGPQAITATFPIDTRPVLESKTVVIRARTGAQAVQANLYIHTPNVKSASLENAWMCDGSKKATMKYTLDGPAAAGFKVEGHVTVSSSGSNGVAATVPTGNSAGSFQIMLPRCQLHGPGERCQINGYVHTFGSTVQVGGSCAHPLD